MISLLVFTGRLLLTGGVDYSPGRYLATSGEIAGHLRGGKWPPMGIFHWPPTVIAMRARMAWVYRQLRTPPGVEHDLVSSSAGQSWVARLYAPARKPGYWVHVEAEERLSVQAYPKHAGDPRWGSVQGPSVKVCLMQRDVRTSADFDWAYLRSLWPTMEAARRDWVSTLANPKAPHDRAAWKQMIADGGPRHLGIGFGEKQAKQRGQCMFGARFQLPADATLGAIAAELNSTSKLLLDLAALP